jgi:hypothetical protein
MGFIRYFGDPCDQLQNIIDFHVQTEGQRGGEIVQRRVGQIRLRCSKQALAPAPSTAHARPEQLLPAAMPSIMNTKLLVFYCGDPHGQLRRIINARGVRPPAISRSPPTTARLKLCSNLLHKQNTWFTVARRLNTIQ